MIAAGLLLAATFGSLWLVQKAHTATPSIAVLPFLNLSGDASNEYLADGVTDELTAVLGERPKLRVLARTSSFKFKGARENVLDIARQLGVGTILEGSIQTTGTAMKVTAQLIDGRTGFHLWARTIERDKRDAPAILEEIAQGISAALRAPAPAAKHAGTTPEVQELYLRGIYLRSQHDPESRQKGLELLEQAAAQDPGYAPAQGALALVYAWHFYHGAVPLSEWAEKAKTAARKALAVDESTVKAHVALGWVLWFHDHDWPRAEAAFQRAIQLNPSYAIGHNLYALSLATRGRSEEALAEVGKARELDPLTFLISTDLGLVAYCARRCDMAKDFAQSVLRISPTFPPAHLITGSCLAAEGQYPAAVKEFERTEGIGDSIEGQGRIGHAQAKAGDRSAALAAIRRIGELGAQGGETHFALAMVYSGLGDKDRAFEYLEESARRHYASTVFSGVDAAFDDLHSDPRFAAIRAQLNLPQ